MYLEKLRLDGRVAVVTGGAQGIGLASAHALGEAGARVIIADRDPAALEKGITALAEKGVDCASLLLDITSSAQVDDAVKTLIAREGRIDILVNNAGIARSETPAEDVEDEHWLNVIDVNLNGTFWCARGPR